MEYKSQALENTGKILKKLTEIYGDQILKILGKANSHILLTFGDGFIAGTPQKVTLFNRSVWIIPIVMANSVRFLGEVGVVAIEGESLKILGITESQEIEKKIQWLSHEETEVV